VLVTLATLHFAGALDGIEADIAARIPERPQDALLGIVNVFSCCVLSWKAFTTMVPAFILGGAIAAFVPATMVLKYLGARAHPVKSFGAAAVSGVVLSLCSCNIVPLFVSIYRRGAGIGPAFTFLFAGPAINVVAMIFTMQVIGWRLGIWRAVGVPLVALGVGLLMSLIFRREVTEQYAQAANGPQAAGEEPPESRLWLLFSLLLGLVVFGAWEMAWPPKIVVMLVLVALTAAVAVRRFEKWELRDWGAETWALVKLVIPILIPAVLVIGAVAAFIDVKLVYSLVGPAPEGAGFWAHLKPILVADLFGALMYFPILSEVAFTKAFLKLGMDVGPALAVLLTGAGLSLPGLLIIARAVGWRKALAYQGLVILLTTAVSVLFASQFGKYICDCMMN
jgi:uncharacterized membrane protein YraQ (UPF0718 family)